MTQSITFDCIVQLTELEANARHQEAETSTNARDYERALSGAQQEVSAYQSILAQTQVLFACFSISHRVHFAIF